MKIQKSEHVTRYTIVHNEQTYIRLLEKNINEEDQISWMILTDGSVYVIEDSKDLELTFLDILE